MAFLTNLQDWLNGNKPTQQGQPSPLDASWGLQNQLGAHNAANSYGTLAINHAAIANTQNSMQSLQNRIYSARTQYQPLKQFASYIEKTKPLLEERGYRYFMVTTASDYEDHMEWCQDACEDLFMAYRDTFHLGDEYPIAFKSVEDACQFKLAWSAKNLGDDEQ
jgi:hypothetical protein